VLPQASRPGDRPHTQDHRRVPRRDGEHDADWLAQREGGDAGRSEGMISPATCVVNARFAHQFVAGERDVEAAPMPRSAPRFLQANRRRLNSGPRAQAHRRRRRGAASFARAEGGPAGKAAAAAAAAA